MNEIIVISGYSPSPGRSPAAQPCASNLKRENNHFYPRSISSLFSIEDRFNLNTDRRSNDKKKEKNLVEKFQKFLLLFSTSLEKVWRNFERFQSFAGN